MICSCSAREAGGEALHGGAELVDLTDTGGAEADDAGRATGHFLDEALLGESVDCFADTGLGDAKSSGPACFDDSFAWGDATGDDFLT